MAFLVLVSILFSSVAMADDRKFDCSEILAGSSVERVYQSENRSSGSETTYKISIDEFSFELNFHWRDVDTSNLDQYENEVIGVFLQIRELFPQFKFYQKTTIVFSKDHPNAEIGNGVVHLGFPRSISDLRTIFAHEFTHVLFEIHFNALSFPKKKSEENIYLGVEEFFADLIAALVVNDSKATENSFLDSVFYDLKGQESWDFFQAVAKYRSFEKGDIELQDFVGELRQLRDRLSGIKIGNQSLASSQYDFLRHIYLGWLRKQIGNHWEKISNNKQRFINQVLKTISYWYLTTWNDSKSVEDLNLFFARELGDFLK